MSRVLQKLTGALDPARGFQGIRPVLPEARRFSGVDLAVLWGDLSVGLLVLLTGALLVPALGFSKAMLAILIGSAIGCLPLALVGLAGAREGVPGMVLFRPILGIRGSYLPSILNFVQLVGWAAVEFWAMASVANAVSKNLFGFDAYLLWLAVVACVCGLLAIGGPVVVVRQWLEKFGVYVVGAAGLWITWKLLSGGNIAAVLHSPGKGGWPTFWLGVDLVIVMPVSWLPLVADFNRFARPRSRSFAGTFFGYFAGNVWFYSLGALLVLAAGAQSRLGVTGIGTAISAIAGGGLTLVVLLAGETDEAFANIYSAAVSAQNVVAKASQRKLIVAVSIVAFGLALGFSMESYEVFLFLIGSVFVPLFGVFAADYFVIRRRSHAAMYAEKELFESGSVSARRAGINWAALACWLAGFVVFHWSAPTGPDWWTNGVRDLFTSMHLPYPLFGSAIGASVPSFLAAFLLALGLLGGSLRAAARKDLQEPAEAP